MKTYIGVVGPEVKRGENVIVVDENGRRYLDPRFDLRTHSPDGFSWGYHGSGCAQLALAILADAIGDERAIANYHMFKGRVVANWPEDRHWIMAVEEVEAIVEEIERKMVTA